MKIYSGKKLTFCVAIAATLAVSYPMYAEGGDRRPGGDWGINRRVRSDDGYVGAEVTFTASFNQPKYDPNVESWPSFYLGGHGVAQAGGEREVDAGLQFDDTPPQGYSSGWSAIISVNSVQCNPRIWDAVDGWQFWRGSANRPYTLKYVVEVDGKLRLDVSGELGSFYWVPPGSDTKSPTSTTIKDGIPDDAPQGQTLNDGTTPFPNVGYSTWPWQSLGAAVMNPTQFNSHSIKRVIAITQKTGVAGALDGTVMTCRVSSAKIYSYANRAELDWTKDRTNQANVISGTGYDTPQNLSNPFAWDRLNGSKVAAGARPKISFPEVDQKNSRVPDTTAYPAKDRHNPIARTDRDSSYEVTEGGSTRYGNETVNLSLRSTTSAKTTPYRAKGR